MRTRATKAKVVLAVLFGVVAALSFVAAPAIAQSNDCCEVGNSPGCADAECEAAVCDGDAFCCDTEWDGFCMEDACNEPLCACPQPGCRGGHEGDPGDCCTINETPGCLTPECEAIVCAGDDYCCDTIWDAFCAGDACGEVVCNCPGANCANDGEPDPPDGGGTPGDPPDGDPPVNEGDCCTANGTIGCGNAACESAVCSADPYCCEDVWDGACAMLACETATCACTDEACVVFDEPDDPPDVDPTPGVGDCCFGNDSPGCVDLACQQCVCEADGLCCSNSWFDTCGSIANNFCNDVCGCTGGGDPDGEPDDRFAIASLSGPQEVTTDEPFVELSVVYAGAPTFPVTIVARQTRPGSGSAPSTLNVADAPADLTLVYDGLIGCSGATEAAGYTIEVMLRDADGTETAPSNFSFDCVLSSGDGDTDPPPDGDNPDVDTDPTVTDPNDDTGGTAICGAGMLPFTVLMFVCLLAVRFVRLRP